MKEKTNKKSKENLRPISQAEMRQNVLKSGLCNELIAGVLPSDGEISNVGGENPSMGMQNASAGQMGQMGQVSATNMGGEIQATPTEEEMQAYINQCRESCTDGEMSIESLVCKVYDLAMQNNALVSLIGKIQTGEAVYIGGEGQNPQRQGANSQMQGANSQMQGANSQMQPQMQNQQMQMQNQQMQMQNQQPQMQNMQMQNPQSQMKNTQPQMQGGYRFVGGASEQSQSVPRSTGGTGGHAQKQAYIPKSQVEKMTREEIRQMFDVIDRSRKEW